ncbi:MAG: thioredoxin domain-containing protein [Chitinivibrionia bacterium]|nr:thioredoxin domain-containing protein [Chitinivibrionia bacterium]
MKRSKNICVFKKAVLLGIIIAFVFKVFSAPVEIGSVEELQTILKQENKLLILEMYADWCRACRMLKPILAQALEEAEEENVQLYRINIDRHRDIAAAFGVRSIPMVFFAMNGNLVHTMLGLDEKEEYLRVIRKFSH